MKILYLGDTFQHSTSAHRAAALRRLGHELVHVNPRAALPRHRIIGGLSVRLGFGVFAPIISQAIKRGMGSTSFDLAWIDTGAEVPPGIYAFLRKRGVKIINYNVDDPFGPRDGRKWSLYRRSVPLHDLTVVVREENVVEAKVAGARQVLRVYRSYDPVAHAPVELSADERARWCCDVSFIGTWMPERGPFMLRLLELGVPLTLQGDWWHKAAEWPRLKSVWRGSGVYGRDFVAATQASKVALGLLSKGNRDRHTTRSAEVPFIGGAVFCAERTDEHEKLFGHGVDAWLWRTPEECADYCFRTLGDEGQRKIMAASARKRIMAAGLANDQVIAGILSEFGW
jgi:hypothetical protein